MPMIELELSAPTHIVKNAELLDPVSLNYPLRVKRMDNNFLPVIGITKIDEAAMPLPNTYGDKSIKSDVAISILRVLLSWR